jgi:hypothetical protein
MSTDSRRPDPLLLWEAGLVIVLVALFVLLFLLPAAAAPFRPHWFAAPILIAGFFGLLFLDRKRRRAAEHRAVRDVVDSRAQPVDPMDEPSGEETRVP